MSTASTADLSEPLAAAISINLANQRVYSKKIENREMT
jgi:hypothetical protein